MNNLFFLVEYLLFAILFLYGVYYGISYLLDRNAGPPLWQAKQREGKISVELKKAKKAYADKTRFFNFWFQVERLKKEKVPGTFAELGVYQGDSALILHLMDTSRVFHLFDTFSGFTEKDLQMESGEAAIYTKHNFADTSLQKVKKKLSDASFVFHEGYFPDTAKEAENETFALVNMDVDLYNPTRAGLAFFYPRLSSGGVIIVHDYNPKWPGIMKAVDDFARTIPEPLIPLTDRDSSVMILKGKGYPWTNEGI